MKQLTKAIAVSANSILSRLGLKIVRQGQNKQYPVEFDAEDRKIFDSVIENKLSMASRERLFTTLMACRYVCRVGMEGDFVECGVWRGGNLIIAADVFRRFSPNKHVFLFDTFAGMTEPTGHDFQIRDREPALSKYKKKQKDSYIEWCYASIDDVRSNLASFKIDEDRVRLIKGDVLDTLSDPGNLPKKISVLRLDTDWYESTKKELEILWPRLETGGILIIDDYGHWGGAKKAVDEFFDSIPRPFFSYADYTGRVAVKTCS